MSARKDRLAKGLCPNCGEEAAPYYYCDRCRFRQLLGRVLDKGVQAGNFKKELRGGKVWYSMADASKKGTWDYFEAQQDDKRLRPRLRGVPVDVEAELIAMLRRAGKPMRTEELYAAWGRMRLRSGRQSAAADLARIIDGRQKQAAKLARRAKRHRKMLQRKPDHEQIPQTDADHGHHHSEERQGV